MDLIWDWAAPFFGFLSKNHQLLLVIFIITVITGILLGFKKTIVVYRNYDDLGMVFLLGVFPAIYQIISGFISEPGPLNILYWFFSAVEVLIFIFVIKRTFRDNSNPILAILALITKIPLSVLFIYVLFSFISPSGSTQSEQRKSRMGAGLLLAVLTPIVLALVQERSGVFNPSNIRPRKMPLR